MSPDVVVGFSLSLFCCFKLKCDRAWVPARQNAKHEQLKCVCSTTPQNVRLSSISDGRKTNSVHEQIELFVLSFPTSKCHLMLLWEFRCRCFAVSNWSVIALGSGQRAWLGSTDVRDSRSDWCYYEPTNSFVQNKWCQRRGASHGNNESPTERVHRLLFELKSAQ